MGRQDLLLIPPTASTRPRSVISPVMATSCRTRMRLSLPAFATIRSGKTTESDQPCFVGVQLESEALEALLEVGLESDRVGLVPKTKHEVVRVTHDNYLTARDALPPLLCPKVYPSGRPRPRVRWRADAGCRSWRCGRRSDQRAGGGAFRAASRSFSFCFQALGLRSRTSRAGWLPTRMMTSRR